MRAWVSSRPLRVGHEPFGQRLRAAIDEESSRTGFRAVSDRSRARRRRMAACSRRPEDPGLLWRIRGLGALVLASAGGGGTVRPARARRPLTQILGRNTPEGRGGAAAG